ncbi:MAG: hypothetical protein H6Q01_963 [Acidobacteria bacterium]|nr:hypothetical protein [Acidobacteriota bacterium]
MRRSLLALVLAALFAPPAPAADPEPRGPALEDSPVNYAYAALLGSGIYTISGRTIQIYTITGEVPLVRPSDERIGVGLILPVTLGFFDFEPEDLLESGLPEGVNTLSFVPGVELAIPLRRGWSLFPWVQAGVALDFAADQQSWIFAGGLDARWERRYGARLLRATVKPFYAGNVLEGFGSYDDYGEVDLGLEAREPLGACLGSAELDLGYFLIAYYYTQDLSFLRAPSTRLGLSNQFEAGFTVGTVRPVRVWGVTLPRVGFSYRFGAGVPAVRLVLGAPF